MGNIVMRGQDALSAKLAECYLTLSGTRYNLMSMIDFEATMEKVKTEVPILGKTGKGNKANGWSGKFKGKAHFNQDILRKAMLQYKKTGEDFYFEIMVVNNDPASAAGKHSVILTGCNLDNIVLAKFDADGEYLDEDIEGTFDDWNLPQMFKELSGMK